MALACSGAAGKSGAAMPRAPSAATRGMMFLASVVAGAQMWL